MRKTACIASLVALGAASPAAAQSVPTRATLETCHTGAAAADRYAVVGAQMGTVSSAKRMQLRFDLHERDAGESFRRVSAPGLGVWRASAPGVDIFRYRKQVTNLASSAEYRVTVRFRWLGANGKTVQRAVRRTAICRQPDFRADLVVGTVTAEPAGQGRARYTVQVRNDGKGGAGGFSVALTVQGERQVLLLDPLAAGATRPLTFTAGRCNRRSPLQLEIDSQLSVDESRETNNARSIPCPIGE